MTTKTMLQNKSNSAQTKIVGLDKLFFKTLKVKLPNPDFVYILRLVKI